MKPPKPKPHVADSIANLVEGASCHTKCNKEIKRVRFVSLADTDWLPGKGTSVVSFGMCPACQEILNNEKPESGVKVNRYLVMEAQELEVEKSVRSA